MAAKTVYMGTTKIEVGKTSGEIIQVLVASGARQVAMEYTPTGRLAGLRFTIPVGGSDVLFELPARVDPLLKYTRQDRAQAERVAWRQLLRWCQAQLAMIEVGMLKAEEVYTPYAVQPNGRTLFEALTESRFKMLAAAQETEN